jgi:hypothetical protein
VEQVPVGERRRRRPWLTDVGEHPRKCSWRHRGALAHADGLGFVHRRNAHNHRPGKTPLVQRLDKLVGIVASLNHFTTRAKRLLERDKELLDRLAR